MTIKDKKILVTGGAGFIGSHLCRALLSRGSKVIVLDDFSTGKMENIKDIVGQIKIIRGSILNKSLVSKVVKICDMIVHEAFPYGEAGIDLDHQYVAAGVEGTFNLLAAAVKSSVKKFIFASSVAVYGLPRYLPIDEKHAVNPFLPYGATKRAGELYCQTFSKLYGLNAVCLRYFYIYGPGYSTLDHSALVNFVNRAIFKKPLLIYGNGRQIRDYTYIDDAVAGTILALEKDGVSGQVFNISSGQPVSIKELAEKVRRTIGGKIKIESAKQNQYRQAAYCLYPIGMTKKTKSGWSDERNYTADLSLSRRALNYQPKVTLAEGLEKTIYWLNEKKYGQK